MEPQIPKHYLIDNEKLSQCLQQENQSHLKRKKFTIVGNLIQQIDSNIFEFSLSGTNGQNIQVLIKSPSFELPSIQSTIIQLSNLKLKKPKSPLTLKTTKKTQILKIDPSLSSSPLNPSKAPDDKDQLWEVLVMPLKTYALSTEAGLKFESKTLVEISEKVVFKGILLSSKPSASHSGLGQLLVFRDIFRNDKIQVYVSYLKTEASQAFMNSLSKFSTFEVKANRMISRSLEIYSKVALSQDHSNLTLIKTHDSPCNQLECPCKVPKGRFTPHFSRFSFIHQIKPFVLFRSTLKLFLRPLFLNFILCKEICSNCQEGLRFGRQCCDSALPVFTLNASFIAEDSTGIAECFVNRLDDLQALFGFDYETLKDFQGILDTKAERVVRYPEFSERIKLGLKNLSPRLRYCIGKVKVKPKDTPLVSLNSDYPGNDINFKIFKVIE